MTTIKATCPSCGEVALTPTEIELRVDEDNPAGSYYGFTCPHCDAGIRKPADDRVVRLLVSGGVPALPAAPVLTARFDHPPLTPDDLLDFHELLSQDNWFDLLRAQVR